MKFFRKIFPAFILAVFFVAGTTHTVLAQSANSSDLSSVISSAFSGVSFTPNVFLDVSPQYPEAHQQVTVTLRAALSGVDSSNIAWYVNGKLKQQGLGSKIFTFTTGNTGEIETVEVDLQTTAYGMIKKSITINPGSLDILWEAQTYTPPFYLGKALPTSQAPIKFVAIPHAKSASGSAINPDSLTYAWYQNYTKSYEESGYGLESATFSGNYSGNSDSIKVEATDRSGATFSKQITINIVNPEIVFYPKDPNLGILYHKAVTNNSSWSGNGLGIIAEPYFFAFDDKNNNPGRYVWQVNYQTIDITGDKSAIFLGFPKGGTGNASFSLAISNPVYLLERANSTVAIHFSNTQSE
ncbi:MAG TPA: hypothetical protein VFM02_00465 [Candidatus Paceibacterota bacterium]|nr:hypothetical protein [Candidatus Paceibacterota bacterium]